MNDVAHPQIADALPADRVVDGQTYTAVDRVPYTTKDGREIALAVWRSHCAICGGEYEVPFGEAKQHFKPTRRCPRHRVKGRRQEVCQDSDADTSQPMFRTVSAEQRRQRRAAAVQAALAADPTLERSFGGWVPDYLLPPEAL